MQRPIQLLSACILAAGVANATAAGENGSSPYPADQRGPVTRFDQRKPAYQESMRHLAEAMQLLDAARERAMASKKRWPVPGFRYDILANDIEAIRSQLDLLLTPERERYRYQEIVPDSYYLTPRADKARDRTLSR